MERFDRFTAAELQAATGGVWDGAPPPADFAILGVVDNSKEILPGMLFAAIRGELTDGHKYVAAAVNAGAAAVLVERTPEGEAAALVVARKVAVLRVPDSLRAMQELARCHRLRFPHVPVVGITGSCGKTSTKEMIAAVLEARFPGAVLKTEGNTNNHFGVPRNLLRFGPQHRAAVIEMGSNHPGEIAALARLVQPQAGVVSNIGHAHLEFFRDLAGVAREKGSLLAALPAGAPAIFPAAAAHADILRNLAAGRNPIAFGLGPDANVRAEYLGADSAGYGVRLTWRDSGTVREFHWGLGGAHQASNAGAAAAVGAALGIPPDVIVAGLQVCRLPGMRMDLREHQGVHWANDAYNSNLDSAMASVEWFREMTGKLAPAQCVLVLGGMRELGNASLAAHRGLLDFVLQRFPAGSVLLVGREFDPALAATPGAAGIETAPDWAGARPCLEKRLRPGAWVLLKGSRGIGLENLLPQDLRTAH